MLSVWSSRKFMLEKAYVWRVLLEDFLGVPYQLNYDDSLEGYEIRLKNDTAIHLRDSFFEQHQDDSYLHEDYIPQTVEYFSYEFTREESIPVIYGQPDLNVSAGRISCEIDIVASCFFMLTRWEEYVIDTRDQHHRFPLQASLAHRAGFYQQPVVHQYLELLWQMLLLLAPELKRKKRKFRVIPTHSVDHIRRWQGFKSSLEVPYRNFLIEKNVRRGTRNLRSLLETKLGLKDDPYDTFDYLMRTSERFGLRSRFYFTAGGETEHDNRYRLDDPIVQELLETIKRRDHRIGLCPSYNAYNRSILLERERDTLQSLSPLNVSKGRQHYLRFEMPITWQAWDDAGMNVDSSMGYPEAPGFRCGTCYAFPVFNFLTRQTLSLYESPLICAETSVIDTMRLSPKAAEQEIRKVFVETQKYQGNFVFLWHNSTLFTEEYAPYRHLYEKILRGF